MATLEKIRQRSVLLIVVIGVALLAFIIGDGITSGRSLFGNDRVAATVGSEKIDIMDFQNRYNEVTQQMQGRTDIDQAVVQHDVLTSMADEMLVNSEFEALGIEVSNEELTEAMIGKTANYQIYQFAQQVGAESPAQLYEMINNPANFGLTEDQIAPVRAQLLKIEGQIETGLKYLKFTRLVDGALQANNIDKKIVNADNTLYTVNIVKKSANEFTGEEFNPTNAEISAQYNKDKELYKLNQEARLVNFIAVDIKPSAADEAEGQKMFEEAVAALKSTEGTASALANENLIVNERTVTEKSLNNPVIASFLKEAGVEAVSDVKTVENTYSVTKLLQKKHEADSVTINMVAVEGAVALQDSVLNLLNNGTDLEGIAKVKGAAVVQKEQPMNLLQLPAQEAEAKAKLLAAGSGYFKLDSNENSALLCQVTKKSAAKDQFVIAEVSYKLLPSDKTIEALQDSLQAYIVKNNVNETFVKEAVPAGFQAVEALVSSDMAQLNGIKDTRKVIQWIFNAEEGQVSPIIRSEGSNKYISASVNKVFDGAYFPQTYERVAFDLNTRARIEKVNNKLMEDYKGKATDLNGYATAMASKVDTATVNFNQPFIPMVGYDPILAGSVAGSKQGALVGPVKGSAGVYVYTVVSADNKGTQLSDEEAANRYRQRLGGLAIVSSRQNQEPMFFNILREANPVKNNLIKFY